MPGSGSWWVTSDINLKKILRNLGWRSTFMRYLIWHNVLIYCHKYNPYLQNNNSWNCLVAWGSLCFEDQCSLVAIVVVVTLFLTKYMKTHICITHLVVNTPYVHMYCVSSCYKKPRLVELAAVACYWQFCRATARPGPEEMAHWHSGGRFKESYIICSIILLWIISGYVPFHLMTLTFIRNKIFVYIVPQLRSFDPYSSIAES